MNRSNREELLVRSRIEYDPYPDTGETGETYDIELPAILDQVRNRLQHLIDKPGRAMLQEIAGI